MADLSASWGCYSGVADAKRHLCDFVDKVCGPQLGVIWAAEGVLYPLRAPLAAAGLGEIILFEWTGLPPPTPKPPSSDWGRFKAFVERCLEQEGVAESAQSQAYMEMGQSMDRVLGRMFTHKSDGVGVGLDILCIALSLALLPTGIGAVGLLGLIGGSALLYMDGKAYAMEMNGEDEAAEAYKRSTESKRLIATAMTLPDIAYGGYQAIRELKEISELRALDRATAASALRHEVRAANASTAQTYAQLAARANLRAQIRTKQIMASLKLEVTPKFGGAGSVGLLVDEEVKSKDSVLNAYVSRLRVHATAVKR